MSCGQYHFSQGEKEVINFVSTVVNRADIRTSSGLILRTEQSQLCSKTYGSGISVGQSYYPIIDPYIDIGVKPHDQVEYPKHYIFSESMHFGVVMDYPNLPAFTDC